MKRKRVAVQRVTLGHALTPKGLGWKLEQETPTRRVFARLIAERSDDADPGRPSSTPRASDHATKGSKLEPFAPFPNDLLRIELL